ncbi:MAG: DUF4974 domain-containing protein [Odoribacteraceae bacterium]|jgi:ferric-dicitrate binding protein FerR (iron transport regulator)|nr:DUF4974 domain-containing protein [Odoribacteraceae bacterium]
MNELLERIITLLKKAYSGTITPDEQRELERFLENKRLRAVYDELTKHELLREGIETERLFPYRRAFAVFRRRARRRRVAVRRLVVAASVGLLLATSSYLYLARAGGEEPRAVESPVIPPGRARASIRLASGETVAVSADTLLRVEERGGTSITYEEGKIVYRGEAASGEPVMNELTVPPGGECRVVFDDGTVAWVNADSKLTYPVLFTGGERVVHLEGEAYFEVKQEKRPFIVRARLGAITATGTEFAVRVYREEAMAATLVSGRVRYTGFATEDLAPGEQVVISPSGETAKNKVDIQEHVGWKEGLFVFHRRSLESIMKELARWYECTVSYEREELKALPFSGHLKRYDNINAFLELLRATGEVDYTIHDRHVLLR